MLRKIPYSFLKKVPDPMGKWCCVAIERLFLKLSINLEPQKVRLLRTFLPIGPASACRRRDSYFVRRRAEALRRGALPMRRRCVRQCVWATARCGWPSKRAINHACARQLLSVRRAPLAQRPSSPIAVAYNCRVCRLNRAAVRAKRPSAPPVLNAPKPIHPRDKIPASQSQRVWLINASPYRPVIIIIIIDIFKVA